MMDDRKIKEIAVLAAEAADNKKATDIIIMDVSELTSIADFFVLCNGNSEIQVKAIVEAIEEDLAAREIFPQRIAGKEEARWVLMDYADVIVHVFHREEREYYELDRLWADAEKILLNS